MELNFSIGSDPMLDCALAGWPTVKREEFMASAQALDGVNSVGGAGKSHVRIYHAVDADMTQLTSDLTELANQVLPGHNFQI